MTKGTSLEARVLVAGRKGKNINITWLEETTLELVFAAGTMP